MALYKMVDNERIKLTAEEEAELEQLRQEADLDFTSTRMERNGRLNISDWTQLADAPVTEAKKTEWATYRQELRDYPAQASKVSELPSWPNEPT
jgi:hypothetical protein